MLDGDFPTAALARCHRLSAAIVHQIGSAPPHFRNVRLSSIDGLQSLSDVLSTVLVTCARTIARTIQVYADPPFVIDCLQNAVACRKIDVAITQIVDALEKFGL